MDLIKTIWGNFRNILEEKLKAANEADQKIAWCSPTERTKFYAEKLLPELEKALNFSLEYEFLNVDYALCDQSTRVPLIFIESENFAESAAEEMRKLCSLSAPLKVLICVTEWCEEPGYWPPLVGQKSKLLEEWKKIIKAHYEIWPQACLYGIVIGERKENTLRFYSYGLWADGRGGDPHKEILVERKINF
jgi:hypothetical protein